MGPERTDPAFMADMMLGRLVRWMRILGYDVLYQNPVDDEILVNAAREQGRILLTRDTRLVKRRAIGEHLLIHGNDPLKQLGEVVVLYPPDPDRFLDRCIRCNATLIAVLKQEVMDDVPDYIYHTESNFGRCPECERVFWPGTHAHHMAVTCRQLIRRSQGG